MAHIPKAILDRLKTALPGLTLINQGKVRDTYTIPDFDRNLLSVVSDRISAFDFVLKALIPYKGYVLNAMSHFWTTQIIRGFCQTDFVTAGSDIDQYLKGEVAGNPDFQARATVITRLHTPPIEDIVRLYLVGNGWKAYKEYGTICGHRLPEGLTEGCRLPTPLYTPTTKASEGHDQNIDVGNVTTTYGYDRERQFLMLAGMISSYAASSGIILADCKGEMANGILIDEKFTPDCCRFWDAKDYAESQAKGKLPKSLDKQYVRDWLKTKGVDKMEPTNPEHIKFVDELELPESVIRMTSRLYRYIFWRLIGVLLETYQRDRMGIEVSNNARLIEVVVGSQSDLPQTLDGIELLRNSPGVTYRVNVVSCHRNPSALRLLSKDLRGSTDVVIAGAGKAAQLPAVLKALLCEIGASHIPVIGVAFKGATLRDDLAATLSIEDVPEQPVELDRDGKAYFGPDGFIKACRSAVNDEFLPRSFTAKEPVFGQFIDAKA